MTKPSPYVYQYLWHDESLPRHKNWVMTLTDEQAPIQGVMLSILLAESSTSLLLPRALIRCALLVNRWTG
jgi:hypothetical protein